MAYMAALADNFSQLAFVRLDGYLSHKNLDDLSRTTVMSVHIDRTPLRLTCYQLEEYRATSHHELLYWLTQEKLANASKG